MKPNVPYLRLRQAMNRVFLTVISFFLAVLPAVTHAQLAVYRSPSQATTAVPLSVQTLPLAEALTHMEQQYQVTFIYIESHVANKYVPVNATRGASLEESLNKMLPPLALGYKKVADGSYVIRPEKKPKSAQTIERVSPPAGMGPVNKAETLKVNPLLGQPTLANRREEVIRGKVKDVQTNEPIAAATVLLVAGGGGAYTNEEGLFDLKVSQLPVMIRISFLGYEAQEIRVSSTEQVDVLLTPKVSSLEEVVVVGFSTQKKSDLTGAVVKVTTDDIPQIPVVNVAEALRGRAAGVLVSQGSGLPGRGPTIRIRGESSINASNEPLVVIDGAPGGDIATLNFNDVESFEILKDAAATSIFGKQGANGVILITTRRGKEGKSQVDFNMKSGFRLFPEPQPVLDGRQFFEYLKEVLPNTPVAFSDRYFANYQEETLSTIDTTNLMNTNWQDIMFDVGRFDEYNLAFSSGTQKFTYRLSGSYLSDKGIIQPAEFNRYNVMINIDAKPTDKLRIYSNFNYALTTRTGVNDGGLGWNGGVVNATLQYPSFLPVRDDATGNFFPNPLRPNIDSPAALAGGQTNNDRGNSINGYFKATYELVKNLRLRTEWFGRVNFSRSRSFYDRVSTYTGRERNGLATDQTTFSQSSNIQNFIEYSPTLGKHTFNLLVGHTANFSTFEQVSILGFDFATDNFVFVRQANQFEPPREGLSIGRAFAGVARLDYNYDDRFLAQLNFRADGSANFAPGNKWGYFPSASFGWKLSEEAFLKQNNKIDLLKVRAGTGVTGNDDIGFAYLSVYGSSPRSRYPIFGTDEIIPVFARTLSNPNLRWETTFETNIGIDFIGWNGRVEVNVDLYNRNSFDLLYNRPVPITTGSSSVADNLGRIRNRGVEVFLSTTNVQSKKFSWRTDFNFAYNDNRIMDLGEGTMEDRTDVDWIAEGYPLNGLFGYQVDRLFQADDFDDTGKLKPGIPVQVGARPGDIKFVNQADNVDVDRDGEPDAFITADDDRVFLGFPFPPYTFGLTNRLTYQGFTLVVFLQGVYGNSIFNQTRTFTEGMDDFFNQSTVVLNRWTPENTDTDIPRAVIGDPNGNNRISDRWIEDGSYLRIKDVMLSYDVPPAIRSLWNLKMVRVFASAQNVWTLTRYSGFDPEVGRIDNGTYPQVRSLIFGVNVSL